MTTAGTELEPYAVGPVEEYRARIVMAPQDAKALDDQLRACMRAVLREGVDYGVIPGTGGDKALFRPGAQKLLQWFGLGFTCDRTEIDLDADGRKEGVTYRCTVTRQLPDGRVVALATCEGYAGYDEDRYYKTAEQAQRKAEENERFFAHRDKRPPRPTRWQGLPEYRAPWNTVIKMAQKRAIVGAAKDATAASGIFGDDPEDRPRADEDDVVIADSQPADDPQWDGYTATAPRTDRAAAQDGDSRPWAERALEEADTFKTEAEGGKLWREAAARTLAGECTPGQQTHIQNRVTARIGARRRQASDMLLLQLSESDDWRPKVQGLTDDEEARAALQELGQLKAAGTMDETRAGRISRAIIARYPKAAAVRDDDGA